MPSPESSSAVKMDQLGKRFAHQWVLTHLNLEIRRGESVALFGKNGSGKSTLLNLIATLLAPTTGYLQILGEDPKDNKARIRQQVRLLRHDKQLYGALTVMENMKLAAGFRNLPSDDSQLLPLLERLRIADKKNQRVSELSEGTQKRLVLARLLIGEPELILLDEPHPNLDTESREILGQIIREWRQGGKTILIASHDHEQTLAHVDRMIVLEEGRIY